jgi:hypothetical protein
VLIKGKYTTAIVLFDRYGHLKFKRFLLMALTATACFGDGLADPIRALGGLL